MNRALLLSLCLCLSAGLCAQGDLEGRLDLQRLFLRLLEVALELLDRVEAVMTLEGNECQPGAATLVKLLSHKSAAVRDAALVVLSGYREQATFQPWIDALPDEKDARKAAVTIKLLGRAKLRAAVPAIEGYVAGAKRLDGGVKYEAARALMAIGDAGDAGLLGQFVTASEAPVRMAACDAICKLKVKELGDAVTALLKDDAWQVQTAAIEAVAALRPQAAVPPVRGRGALCWRQRSRPQGEQGLTKTLSPLKQNWQFSFGSEIERHNAISQCWLPAI